ncbi:hypothetical protein ACFWXT_29365 [Bacillus cereus]|uniref:hypothetical protein n=1 Tax=Bacillus cereus TaxID=1396 RepID=UPI0036712C7A
MTNPGTIPNMKANTSVSLDDAVLEQSREAADLLGISVSAFTEAALRDRVLVTAAIVAADYERAQGRDTEEHFAAVEAERAAMAEAIRADSAAW